MSRVRVVGRGRSPGLVWMVRGLGQDLCRVLTGNRDSGDPLRLLTGIQIKLFRYITRGESPGERETGKPNPSLLYTIGRGRRNEHHSRVLSNDYDDYPTTPTHSPGTKGKTESLEVKHEDRDERGTEVTRRERSTL